MDLKITHCRLDGSLTGETINFDINQEIVKKCDIKIENGWWN
jgi:hypothetical protein